MTDAGIRTIGEVSAQPKGIDRAELGSLVQRALLSSTKNLVAPAESHYQPLLAATGLATMRDFFLTAAMVIVEADSSGTMIVSRVEKPKQGNEVRFSAGDDALGATGQSAVGDAIIRMLEANSSRYS